MFALLGDIKLNMHTSPESLDGTFSTDFADLDRISGKPGLQHIGDALDEYNLSFGLHYHNCDPQAVWQQLEDARKSHKAQALVLGSDYRGYFVITDSTCNIELADKDGKVQGLVVTLTLREFIGDPSDPLKPPSLPGVKGNESGISEKVSGAKGDSPPGSFGNMVRTATKYAKKAQSALQQAQHVIQVAKQFKDDPLGAMQRLPGMMNSLGGVTGALGEAIPALGEVSKVIKDVAPAVNTLSSVAGQVKQASGTLENLKAAVASGDPLSVLSGLSGAAGSLGGITGSLGGLADTLPSALGRIGDAVHSVSDGVTGAISHATADLAQIKTAVSATFNVAGELADSAMRTFKQAAPALSRLDALVITRRV